MGEAPAGVLAGETGDDGIIAGDGQPERPFRRAGRRRQRDLAKSTHADFDEQQAGVDAARDLGAGVDQQFARGAARHRDPIARRAGDQPVDDLASQKF